MLYFVDCLLEREGQLPQGGLGMEMMDDSNGEGGRE